MLDDLRKYQNEGAYPCEELHDLIEYLQNIFNSPVNVSRMIRLVLCSH